MNTLTLLAALSLQVSSPASSLTVERTIDAPVSKVWEAFTTTAGVKSWMVAEAEVDLKIGGEMRTGYAAGTDLHGPNAIVNTYLSFDPERMVSFHVTHAPEKFPFKNAIAKVWTVLYFEPAGKERTHVTCKMLGYGDDQESQQMRKFFEAGNRQTMDELENHFKAKTL